MAVKYQVSLVTRPKELILVTLNHLDSALPFVADSPTCVNLIELTYKRLFTVRLRFNFIKKIKTILNFFISNFKRLI